MTFLQALYECFVLKKKIFIFKLIASCSVVLRHHEPNIEINLKKEISFQFLQISFQFFLLLYFSFHSIFNHKSCVIKKELLRIIVLSFKL